MTLRPGDVVTEEPPIEERGSALFLEDRDGDVVRWDGEGWRRSGVRFSWEYIIRYAPITVLHVPTPDATPAEDWEPVTAEEVRVGDEIEMSSGDATVRGPVVRIDPYGVASIGEHWAFETNTTYGAVTIRRRVRQPMAEPDAPAVVRHAGRIWVRQELHTADVTPAKAWWPLDIPGGNATSNWLSWSEVLVLDPATDPVVVDLGGA